MASQTDICNFALTHLGEKRIQAITDGNERARLCTLFYDQSRKEMLELANWNAAVKRASLAADPTPPTWDFEQRYQKPADCIRVIGINQHPSKRWQVEGDFILTNVEAPLEMLYVFNETDVTKFSPLMVEAFSLILALRLSENITTSSSKRAQIEALFSDAEKKAKRMDAVEGNRRTLAPTSFVEVRR